MSILQIDQRFAGRIFRLVLLAGCTALDPEWPVCLWAPLAAMDQIGDCCELLRLMRNGARSSTGPG